MPYSSPMLSNTACISCCLSRLINIFPSGSTRIWIGHTGVIPAAIKAVERVDQLVGDAVQAVKDVDGVLFICADHGNAEKMIDYETGKPHTAHTTNPVPFILVNADPSYKLREGGCLADIAPTLLEIMGLPQPAEMTGKSLIVK